MSTAQRDFSEVKAEPVVGPIYAARIFRINHATATLAGLVFAQTVLDGVNVSTCAGMGDHEAPLEGCTCGFYCYDQPLGTGNEGPQEYWALSDHMESIRAVVELSGKVIVCERGLKAQYMRVVAMTLDADTPEATRNGLAKNYPEVAFFDSDKDMLKEFPLSAITREVQEEGEEPSRPRRARKVTSAISDAFGKLLDSERVGNLLDAMTMRSSLVVKIMMWTMLALALGTLMPSLIEAFGAPLLLLFAVAETVGRKARGPFSAMAICGLFALAFPAITPLIRYSMFEGLPAEWGWLSAMSGLADQSFFADMPQSEAIEWGRRLVYLSLFYGVFRSEVKRHRARQVMDVRRAITKTTQALAFAQPAATAPETKVLGPGVVPAGVRVKRIWPDSPQETQSSEEERKDGDPHG